VTIHAIRRYAQRVLGIEVSEELDDVDAMHALEELGVDLEAIRERIHSVCDEPASRGAVGVKFDGIRALIKSDVVVTILQKSPPGPVYERPSL
jgi:hypothetical protein